MHTKAQVAHENMVDGDDFVAYVDDGARFSSTTRHEPLHEHLHAGDSVEWARVPVCAQSERHRKGVRCAAACTQKQAHVAVLNRDRHPDARHPRSARVSKHQSSYFAVLP